MLFRSSINNYTISPYESSSISGLNLPWSSSSVDGNKKVYILDNLLNGNYHFSCYVYKYNSNSSGDYNSDFYNINFQIVPNQTKVIKIELY